MGAITAMLALTALVRTTRYAVRWTWSSPWNWSVNGTASRKPVSTCTPVCVERSSWISSVQLRLIVASGSRSGSGSGMVTAAR